MACFPVLKVPAIPDEVEEVDAGDVVEGLGVDGWRRPRRVRRVGGWFLVVSGDQDLAMEAMN